MEQPPGDSDDLQPQDLSSTRSLPAAIDLTRKGEDCLVKANSMEPLQVVKPPSWYPGSGSSKGLSFPETDPDHRLQPGDQIQPDNAFSNTTVTLSYVSRSHVFSAHDSLSQHSSLYCVPSISKFSTMDGYLQQMDRPLGLVPQSEMFDSMPRAQVVGENVAGVCLMQQAHEINSSRVASNGGVEKYKPQQRGSSMDHSLSQDADHNAGLKNGRSSSSWSNSAICIDSSPEPLITDMEEEEEEEGRRRADSEVLFLISSRTEEPVLIQDNRDLCSHNREYISPLEDPVSPSVTTLDDVEDVFILPQASCTPSFENYLADETADTSLDELERGGPGLSAVQGIRSNGDNTPMLDTSKDYQQSGHKPKAASESIVDLTEDESTVPEILEKKPKETAASHLNGNAKAEQRTFEKKKLPPRSGRGTRLEAIVMNINPNWYKVSTKKPKASKTQTQPPTNPQTQSSPSKANVSPNKHTSSVGKKKVQNKAASSSEGETKVKAARVKPDAMKGCMDSINRNTDSCKESTSDSEHTCFSKYPHNHSTSPKTSSPPFAPVKDSEKESEHRESDPEPSEVDVLTVSRPLKTSPKSHGKHKAKTTCSEAASPTAKTMKATPAPKKKRKKPRLGQFSSMFSPQEPEIKLKYVNYKEEKRDIRRDTFSPFIHMDLKPSSTSPANCTVINYPEEEKPRQKKGQGQQQSGGFIPGAIPSTSCLHLGRISTHSQYHSSLVCCLCRGSANAMDLGDLHGPYYPEGYRPSTKPPVSTPGLKEEEEDFSDSDSSCSMRGQGRKCARPPGVPWPHKPGPRLNQDGLLGRWTSDPSGSPAAKRARIEAGTGAGVTSEAAAAVEDWYSAPVVPLDQCEYWLHEDCSIWSAGVFLVKGRVYGLEEAVKVAQETTCSRCDIPGATLGCFFKGCPNKYHYRCSLQSDCVLNEENFSMKCTKHKNKSFKGPPGSRRDDR
ncbi:transcription factor 20 [Coregonus clupeaformis]|uniref:transcription factor 20 n=1 Tax=Coregonus clupeaformis TaxID=59861 RepID=UPI001BDFA8AE|nr:transcription factor 20 [Coregonus clupeaformis]